MTKEKHIIGKDNWLPWDIPEELEKFRAFTKNNTVIMGRTTFETLDSKPLPKRNNIIISTTLQDTEGIEVARSIPEAVEKGKKHNKDIYIIGGAKVYSNSFEHADYMYLSFIKKEYLGDTIFPEFDESLWNIEKREDYQEFEFVIYKKK